MFNIGLRLGSLVYIHLGSLPDCYRVNTMEKKNLKKNVLCYQSLMALLFSVSEDEMDESFMREAEEIIAEKSGLPKNSIFRYDLDK
jgi:hypothetical protein